DGADAQRREAGARPRRDAPLRRAGHAHARRTARARLAPLVPRTGRGPAEDGDGVMRTLEEPGLAKTAEAAHSLRHHTRPLVTDRDLDPLMERIGDARY